MGLIKTATTRRKYVLLALDYMFEREGWAPRPIGVQVSPPSPRQRSRLLSKHLDARGLVVHEPGLQTDRARSHLAPPQRVAAHEAPDGRDVVETTLQGHYE